MMYPGQRDDDDDDDDVVQREGRKGWETHDQAGKGGMTRAVHRSLKGKEAR